ncbi:MAG: magnesium transporter [Clostridia bacterium]|nr:magnesium transporter [Clostridia bacterium]
MDEVIVEKIVELIKEKKINELHEMLEDINSADFPALFEEVNQENVIIIYRLLSKEKAAEVFAELDSDVQERLINVFTDKELKSVIDDLFMDDTVDLIEEMPSNVVKRILKNIKSSDRKIINELLKYPEDSAGTIMTTEFIDLKKNMTVQEGFDKIKKIGLKKETVYNCYVVDTSRKLVGSIDIKEMLISERDAKIEDIMEDNAISVLTTEDKEEVAKMFDKYNFVAMPVVDKENRLVGIVTIDDAIDVLQDENTEDFEKMAAISPNEDTYFKTSAIKHAKNRIVWLLLLMLSATFTGLIIERFQTAIAAVPLLATFMTMISGTGGNCGSQSSTLIIRGLVLEEIKFSDLFKAIWKELRVAIIVGGILAIVTGLRIFLQYQGALGLDETLKLAQVVGITLILTAIIAEFLGCILPMLAKKLKLDPAIMASPLITTIVDLCSMLVYFNIATWIMGL